MTANQGLNCNMPRQYLLFSAISVGLGHLFHALLNSAYYAYRTDRVLALDMREFGYAKDNQHEFFFQNFGFEFPPELEVITDLDEVLRLRDSTDVHYFTLSDSLDVNNPFPNEVLHVPCFSHGIPYSVETKHPDLPFRVVLRGELLGEWHRVLARPEWSGHVIGMHYRGTVGEFGPRMTRTMVPDYDERYRALKDAYIAKALAAAQEHGFANPSFLVASDDAEFVAYVQEHLPGAFSLATRRPDQEWLSHMRASGFDFGILVGAVIDMWGLTYCDYLIHSQSGFTNAAILNSPKLNRSNTFEMPIPNFPEILATLEPEQAVEWTRRAIRLALQRRTRLDFLETYLADALDRVGDAEGAAAARRRAQWLSDVHHAPVIYTADRAEIDAEVRAGKFDRAIARAQRAVEQMPDNPFFLASFGQSLSDLLAAAGRYQEALAPARGALAIVPDDPLLHAHLARLLTQIGEPDAAERTFLHAIELDPEMADIRLDLADLLVRQERWDEALAATQAAIDIDPSRAWPHRRRGHLLLRRGQFAPAEKAFRQAMAVGPEPAIQIELGEALGQQGKFDEAIALAQAAVESQPDNAYWHHQLGNVYFRADRIAEAEAEFRRAMALRDDVAAFGDGLYAALERQGRLEEAIEQARRAAEQDPLVWQRYARLGHACLRAGQFAEAEAALRQAIALQDNAIPVHELLSRALEQQDRVSEAADVAVRIAELDPDNSGRWGHAAVMMLRAQRFADSEVMSRRVLVLRDGDMGAHHVLSIALERLGRLDEAIAAAQRVVEIDPGAADRHVRLGALLMHAGSAEHAEAAVRAGMQRFSRNAMLEDALAAILEQQNRMDEAIGAAQRAAELEPNEATRRIRLGEIRQRAGDMTGADVAFRRAAELDPANGVAMARLKALHPEPAPEPSAEQAIAAGHPVAAPVAEAPIEMPPAPAPASASEPPRQSAEPPRHATTDAVSALRGRFSRMLRRAQGKNAEQGSGRESRPGAD